MKKSYPLVFIISGPSGAGKTTLLKRLFRKKHIQKNFVESVSYTTRPPRAGEKDGRDYFFVTKTLFRALLKKKFFLEYEKVIDDYYGTPKHCLENACKQKKSLILCIDVKGGIYVRKAIPKKYTTTIFIGVPDKKELYGRLKKRAEKAQTIRKRIRLAKKELQFIKDYDYLIINQDLSEAIKQLESVLEAERLRKKTR